MKQLEHKTIYMKYIELQRGASLEELLHDMYITQELSMKAMGEELGVHYHTIRKWLELIGIDVRLPQEKLLEVMEIRRALGNDNK